MTLSQEQRDTLLDEVAWERANRIVEDLVFMKAEEFADEMDVQWNDEQLVDYAKRHNLYTVLEKLNL